MMTAGPHRDAGAPWPRRLVAMAAAVFVLAIGVVAASPVLHQWLHPDAAQADHECAITLFSHGAIESGTVAALVIVPLLLVAALVVAPDGPDLIAPRYRWSPERAPPGR